VWAECRDFIYKNRVRTSQEPHYVSMTKTNRLMLFGEIIAVYCENHTEHINTLCGQNAEFLNFKAIGRYSYHCRLPFVYLPGSQLDLSPLSNSEYPFAPAATSPTLKCVACTLKY
jgi:hypothetical protein